MKWSQAADKNLRLENFNPNFLLEEAIYLLARAMTDDRVGNRDLAIREVERAGGYLRFLCKGKGVGRETLLPSWTVERTDRELLGHAIEALGAYVIYDHAPDLRYAVAYTRAYWKRKHA